MDSRTLCCPRGPTGYPWYDAQRHVLQPGALPTAAYGLFESYKLLFARQLGPKTKNFRLFFLKMENPKPNFFFDIVITHNGQICHAKHVLGPPYLFIHTILPLAHILFD